MLGTRRSKLISSRPSYRERRDNYASCSRRASSSRMYLTYYHSCDASVASKDTEHADERAKRQSGLLPFLVAGRNDLRDIKGNPSLTESTSSDSHDGSCSLEEGCRHYGRDGSSNASSQTSSSRYSSRLVRQANSKIKRGRASHGTSLRIDDDDDDDVASFVTKDTSGAESRAPSLDSAPSPTPSPASSARLPSTVVKYMIRCEGRPGIRSRREEAVVSAHQKGMEAKEAAAMPPPERDEGAAAGEVEATTCAAPDESQRKQKKVRALARSRRVYIERIKRAHDEEEQQPEEAATADVSVAAGTAAATTDAAANESTNRAVRFSDAERSKNRKTFLDFVERLVVEKASIISLDSDDEDSIDNDEAEKEEERAKDEKQEEFRGGPDLPKPTLRRYSPTPQEEQEAASSLEIPFDEPIADDESLTASVNDTSGDAYAPSEISF